MTDSRQILTDSLVKRSGFGTEAAKIVGDIAPYYIPYVGGVLSARDAVVNLNNVRTALHNRNWRRVFTQGLAAAGNGFMAGADYIPVFGTAARAAVLTAKTGVKLGKAVRASRAIGHAAKATLNGGRILKGVDAASDAGKILHRGIRILDEGGNYGDLIRRTQKIITKGELAPDVLKAHKKVLRQAKKYNAFQAAATGHGMLSSVLHPLATTHGLGANLFSRAPDWAIRGMSHVGKNTGITGSYAKMQRGGFGALGAGLLEGSGWSKPKQIDSGPLQRTGSNSAEYLFNNLIENQPWQQKQWWDKWGT